MDKLLETNRALDKIISTIGDLPATPVIITKLMNLTSDLNTDIEKISKAIMADQSLTAKVLKISNSSFYGRAREVKTLREAIVILGFMTLHSLVIATSTQGLYRKSIDDGVSDKLWEHAFAVAIASRMIAKAVGYHAVEEAFVAGLLHDIGKLVLAQKIPKDYRQIVKQVEESKGRFVDDEEKVLGFDHTDVGTQLMVKWSFPPELANAVKYHHDLSESDDEYITLTRIINLSNFMAKKLGVGFDDYKVEDLSQIPSAAALNLDGIKLEELQEKLSEHYENERELFRL